eukprot:m.200554 g.200554  ORF g.200554 m.200554 type:complete len:511 (-) comp15738_c0_seq2:76-1608(-)
MSSQDFKAGRVAVLCSWILILLIGAPLGYLSLRVYRAALPYTAIEGLPETSSSKVFVDVLGECNNCEKSVQDAFSIRGVETDVKEISNVEGLTSCDASEILNEFQSSTSKTRAQTKNSGLVIYVKHGCLPTTSQGPTVKLQGRVAVLLDIEAPSAISEEALDILVDVIIGSQDDQDKTLEISSSYFISFSLLVSDPGDYQVSWNLEDTEATYFAPLAEQLKGVVDLVSSSQYLFYTAIEEPVQSDTGDSYFYGEHILSRFLSIPTLNPTSPVIQRPRINFALYAPERRFMPLHLRLPNGSQAAWNFFGAPDWGGLVLIPGSEDFRKSNLTHLDVDTSDTMMAFIWQLRNLLDIPVLSNYYMNSPCHVNRLDHWELDRFLRRQYQRNMKRTKDGLMGLKQSLEEIPNMVIEDAIQSTVEQSVAHAQSALQAINVGDLPKAFSESNLAMQDAEKAFYNPSILGLLYFPQDELYAVFLPSLLPFFVTMLGITKYYWRKGKQITKESEEKEKSE